MKVTIVEFNSQNWISLPENKTIGYKAVLKSDGLFYVPLRDFIIRSSWDTLRGDDILHVRYLSESNSISISLSEGPMQGARLMNIADVLKAYGVDWCIDCYDCEVDEDGSYHPSGLILNIYL